jgi:hypothetical protein
MAQATAQDVMLAAQLQRVGASLWRGLLQPLLL